MIDNSNIENRLIKSYLWSFAKFVVSIGRQLLLVPLFLSIWNKETFSSWLLILSVAILVSGLSLGYFQYVVNKINLLFHINKTEATIKYGEGLRYGAAIVAFIFFLFGLDLAARITTDHSLFSKISGLHLDIHIATFLLITNVLLSQFILRYVIRILDLYGRIYEVLRIEFIFAAAELIAICIGLYFQLQLIGITILILATTTLLSAYTFLLTKRVHPDFFLSYKSNDSDFLADFKSSTGLLINNIVEKANTEGYPIFIAKFIDPILIPIFSTQKAIGNLIITLNNYALVGLTPDQQRIFAKGENLKVISIIKMVWYIAIFPAGILLIASLPFIEKTYNIWTKNVLEFDPKLFSLILTSSLLFVFGNVIFSFLKSINQTKVAASISIVRCVLLFSLAFIFRDRGLESVGIGLVVAEFFGLILISIWYSLKVIPELNIMSTIFDFIPFLLVSIALINFGYFEINYLDSIIIILLIALGIINWYRLEHKIRARILRLIRFNTPISNAK